MTTMTPSEMAARLQQGLIDEAQRNKRGRFPDEQDPLLQALDEAAKASLPPLLFVPGGKISVIPDEAWGEVVWRRP